MWKKNPSKKKWFDQVIIGYKINIVSLTFIRGTFSFSGEIIAKMSLVRTGGAPGSVAGAVPNSKLYETTHNQD